MSAKQAINDKLQGSAATNFRCGGVVIKQIEKGLLLSLWVKIFLNRWIFGKVTSKNMIVSCTCALGKHTAKRPESIYSMQTAFRSVQPCLQGSRLWPTDRQTDKRTPRYICNNRPHLMHCIVMRPSNNAVRYQYCIDRRWRIQGVAVIATLHSVAEPRPSRFISIQYCHL